MSEQPPPDLEPATLTVLMRSPDMAVDTAATVAAISAAISLKRIADALEAAVKNGALDPYFFENAAYQAGLAFERGRR